MSNEMKSWARPLTQPSRLDPVEQHRLQIAAEGIVAQLLEAATPSARALPEASVHRARRSRIWIATFTGPAGGQRWRSTGLTDRDQALVVARQWEARAREERVRLRRTPPLARLRVGSAERASGLMTQQAVAKILGMSERGVREVERRALAKLRNHPLLRELWRQYGAGELEETISEAFTVEEIQALFDVAVSADELHVIEEIVARLAAPRGCELKFHPVSAPVGVGND